MNDFEPAPPMRDGTISREQMLYDDWITDQFTRDEAEAIEFSELFAKTTLEDQERYWFACISRGLNPGTQEPWTEEEIKSLEESLGFDPRNLTGWVELDKELDSIIRNYHKEQTGLLGPEEETNE